MTNIERSLAIAFPAWAWTVSGAADEAVCVGKCDGQVPLVMWVRANRDGTLTTRIDAPHHRYQATAASLVDCAAAMRDEADSLRAASTLYQGAIKSLRARRATKGGAA